MKRTIIILTIALGLNLIPLEQTKIHDDRLIDKHTYKNKIEPNFKAFSTIPLVATAHAQTPVKQAPGGSNELLKQAGIPESDWEGMNYIFKQESGFCATKWEGERGGCPAYHGVPQYAGYGICQSTPAHKMASAGADWATNPITQLKWCYKYALEYGSIQSAVNYKKCTGRCFSPRTNNFQQKATPWF